MTPARDATIRLGIALGLATVIGLGLAAGVAVIAVVWCWRGMSRPYRGQRRRPWWTP